MNTKVIKGIDIPFRVTLKDATGTPINPESLTGMIILLYYQVSGQILSKYSLKSIAGYEDIHVITAASGLVELRIPASLTKDAQTGVVMMEVKMKSENTDWADGDFETGVNEVPAFELIESRLKNATY